ncbi:MAG TPA: SPFH domain-containing protein [Myxococcaceae bacterium]|nr:SPFH domain-containing protein [Myxococcaceae bacterium]
MWLIGLAVGFSLYGVYAVTRCFFQVRQGHLAVLTAFGRALVRTDDPKRLKTYGPGLHVKRPWEKVHDVPMMEQNLDLSGEEGGQTAMAEDGTVLRFDSILRYVPVESELSHFLFGMRSPLEHTTGLFTCLLRNEIANFRATPETSALLAAQPQVQGGSYALIRRERGALNRRIETFSRKEIGRRYGIQFNAVDLVDILPPDELADALNAVIQAGQEAEAQYARAESDCEQRVLAAERGVAIAQANAKAAETEILRLGDYLSDLARQKTLLPYVDRRRAEVTSESRLVYLKGAR